MRPRPDEHNLGLAQQIIARCAELHVGFAPTDCVEFLAYRLGVLATLDVLQELGLDLSQALQRTEKPLEVSRPVLPANVVILKPRKDQ